MEQNADLHEKAPLSDENVVETTLRPQDFAEYVGQPKITSNLKMFIEAANQRGDALDHVLFSGPPGLGKTTLAHIVAKQMGSQLHCIAAPALDKKGDLAAILSSLQTKDVLFIDEIHRLPRVIEEVLYSAMEDFKLDIIIGQGPAAKTLRIDLPPFTLVGATTRTGLLTNPLRDRFGVSFRLDFYSVEDLRKIIVRSAGILKVNMTTEGAAEIARRSRGTPRIANRLLRRVRDFAQVKAHGVVDESVAKEALALLEVDPNGLDAMDRRILATIVEKFDGGPVGIETISAAIGEERDTLEDVYEPFLLQEGFLQRTPRGRLATRKAFDLLGVPYTTAPAPRSDDAPTLF
ncbi:MAG: Holliday junction branch migration DNA helicase RuvB [Deltaproteobacteria bacterium]|nr:Holliday junction branch migration DNA helicase RuvB [Deltaproteobacteria bacterium]